MAWSISSSSSMSSFTCSMTPARPGHTPRADRARAGGAEGGGCSESSEMDGVLKPASDWGEGRA